MTDIKSPEERSRNMAAIRSRDTGPEIYLRKLLFSHGYRYRKNVSRLPGRPDIYMARYNTAVFVHGCFWHRHDGCRYAYTPKSRTDFWKKKFEDNVRRDAVVRRELEKRQIRSLIVWECTVRKMMKSEEAAEKVMEEIEEFLRSGSDTSVKEI